jgi:hypothetical protein
MADPVRWFDALGNCHVCGKPAHGKLMGPRNESYGAYCTKCANARLAKARKEQEKEAAEAKKPAPATLQFWNSLDDAFS